VLDDDVGCGCMGCGSVHGLSYAWWLEGPCYVLRDGVGDRDSMDAGEFMRRVVN
jgi:hypothetical protein